MSLSQTDKVTIQDQQIQDLVSEIDSVKSMIAEKATNEELRLFALHCSRTGLDPFSGQIHFIKRGGKPSFQTSIDGFRVIAERSKSYRGQTEVQFGEDIEKKMYYTEWENGRSFEKQVVKKVPSSATIGVYREGFDHPLKVTVYFNEFCPSRKNQQMWLKMPKHMLAKVAEAHALRKAFPNDLSGLYTDDEMAQAEGSDVEVTDPETNEVKEEVISVNTEVKPDAVQVENVMEELTQNYLQSIQEADTKYKLETAQKKIKKGADAGLLSEEDQEMLQFEIDSKLSKLNK